MIISMFCKNKTNTKDPKKKKKQHIYPAILWIMNGKKEKSVGKERREATEDS